MKEAFYFPHDNNAINDPKLMSVLMSVWLAWIWLYWIIIETMHQQDEWMMTVDQYEKLIRWYLRGNDSIDVQHVLNTYSENGLFLFTSDWKIYAKRVVENKRFREELREKRKNAWKASAEKRASAKENQEDNSTHVEQVLNTWWTRKGKERKGNKKEIETETEEKYIKEKEILEFWKSFSKNIQHDESVKIFESIQKALWKFSYDKIKRWIEIYSKVVDNPNSFFSYRWTLEEFLKREWGLNTFCEKNVSDYVKKQTWEKKPFVDYDAQKKEIEAREKRAAAEKVEFDNKKKAEKIQDEKMKRWFESLPEDSQIKIQIEKEVEENKWVKMLFDSAMREKEWTLMREDKLRTANFHKEWARTVLIKQFYKKQFTS